jgi:hypothetical protein
MDGHCGGRHGVLPLESTFTRPPHKGPATGILGNRVSTSVLDPGANCVSNRSDNAGCRRIRRAVFLHGDMVSDGHCPFPCFELTFLACRKDAEAVHASGSGLDEGEQ